MLCKYCHYEFYVSADTLGSRVRCPNCTGTVNVVDKQITYPCPECGGMLDISIWMVGASIDCPHCQKSIILSLGENSAKYLPESPRHTEMLKTATHKAGEIIGKYRVIRCLGIGGMGEVYLVEHTLLNHRCALKLLKRDIAKDDPEMRARLLREARLASQIQHKNLIAVLDAELDEKSSNSYIVMEYVDGVSIEHILADGPMLEARALEIISEVAEALKVASEHKITHRDIKPANIMLSRTGEIKVADLGIAKVESDGKQNMTLTLDNAVLGTPNYASPEQLRSSHQVDCRADIYSLGATLYHMLTGKRPFEAESVFAVMANVLESELPMAYEVNPEISDKTSALIARMMAKKREDRHADFDELLKELRSGKEKRFNSLAIKKLKKVFSSKYATFAVAGILLLGGSWLAANMFYENKKTVETKTIAKVVKVPGETVANPVVPAVKPVVPEEKHDVAPKPKAEPKPEVEVAAAKKNFQPNSDGTVLGKDLDKNQKTAESSDFELSRDGATLIKCKNKAIKTAVIPDGVKIIGDEAFNECTNLTKITIPKSVTSIGFRAFRECTNLTEITIPDSVKSIGYMAFWGCEKLTEITIPDSVKSIGDKAFYVCRSLTQITIPKSVTSIGNSVFSGCKNLTKITIPDSVTSIGNEAFVNCVRLTEITIPDSVKSIGVGAFRGCENLTKITIPDSVKSIGYRAFKGCTNLTKITIPDSVTSIDEGTFNGCRNLTEITIPDSVKRIGYMAFWGCEKLIEITIPDSVKSIGDWAFGSCTNLTKITIPAHLKSQIFRWGLSASCKVVIVGHEIQKTAESSDFELSRDGTTLIKCKNKEIKTAVIPDGVKIIGERAFYRCKNLTEITIPDSVTSIGNGAFLGCEKLTKITIPDSVTSIGNEVFSWCTNLTEITIPDSVTSIGHYAFYKCTNLTKITIPDSVTSIANAVFWGCEKLTEITIPDSVTSIGDKAFYVCRSLTQITIPNRVTSIGNGAFGRCGNLTEITIPDSVTSIGNTVFLGCEKLTKITIPDSVTSIGDRAFSGCKKLTQITIPNSVTSIGDRAFYECRNLTEITIPDSVTSIEGGAFYNCTNLKYVSLPARWRKAKLSIPNSAKVVFRKNRL